MVNPIGTARLQFIQPYIDEIIAAWGKLDLASKVKSKWPEVIAFVLKSCDYLIRMIETINMPGADKKATVIAALSEIYDITISQSLPLYLKPFAGQIKTFVFGVIVNAAIDYIVSKYNAGNWSASVPNPTTPAEPK